VPIVGTPLDAAVPRGSRVQSMAGRGADNCKTLYGAGKLQSFTVFLPPRDTLEDLIENNNRDTIG
jgi:hypothetical protein